MHVDRTIDARGMPCPGPLMALIGAVREAPVGATIEVLSSDPGSQSDIPAWVAKAGMSMELVSEEDGYRRFVVRKSR